MVPSLLSSMTLLPDLVERKRNLSKSTAESVNILLGSENFHSTSPLVASNRNTVPFFVFDIDCIRWLF